MPQIQPSSRGLLPSPIPWSPDQHLEAMLSDVSRYILDRTEGRGLGFGQLVRTQTGMCLKCQLRPQCPVRRQKIVVCWAHSSLQIGSRCAWCLQFSFYKYRQPRPFGGRMHMTNSRGFARSDKKCSHLFSAAADSEHYHRR